MPEWANQDLTAAIKSTFARYRNTYGAPRIYAELKSTGMACSLNRVARLMRKMGIQAKKRRLYKVTTTNSKHNHSVAPTSNATPTSDNGVPSANHAPEKAIRGVDRLRC